MTDIRELLELAARAMGNSVHKFETWPGTELVFGAYVRDPEEEIFLWRPHGDDGDSTKMRSALKINVLWSDSAVHCLNSFGDAVESFADHNDDRNAALRLCALRVAAEIGRSLK